MQDWKRQQIRMIRGFAEYHKEIDCQGKTVQVVTIVREMRNMEENL